MKAKSKESPELLEALTQILMLWSVEDMLSSQKCRGRSPEVFENSFICKVLDKRLEAFNIDVKIPDYLILIIDLCTDGNPGQSLMILSEILENIPNLKAGHVITPQDFVRVYGDEFPAVQLYPEVAAKLEKRWDSQKTPRTNSFSSDNLCDYPEYWTKFFE